MIRINDASDSRWAGERIGVEDWGMHSSIAWLKGGERQCVLVYNCYVHPDICIHVAAAPGRRWMTREMLWMAFDYPFNQLECERVTGLVPESNKAAIRLDEHLGFKYEGTKRRAWKNGESLIYFGMLREECRWLGVKRHEQMAA